MNILQQIIKTKQAELAQTRRARPIGEVERRAHDAVPPRDFFAAVTRSSGEGVRLIAEIKKASPSAGVIVSAFDPTAIARTYYACGAAALSVLTDETYFQGRLEFIKDVKIATPLPVLRKDFIVDAYQVYESRAAGADAVLLIAEAIEPERVGELAPLVRQLGMTPLVEVHSKPNLMGVLEMLGPPGEGRYLLGINNRDLSLQETNRSTTVRLSKLLPPGSPFISESGLSTREDVVAVQKAGACAILVGESLLRAKNRERKIRELLGRSL